MEEKRSLLRRKIIILRPCKEQMDIKRQVQYLYLILSTELSESFQAFLSLFLVLISKPVLYYSIVTVVSCGPMAYVVAHQRSDGVDDIVVATVEAEIVFLHQNGTPLYGETLKVPELRVKKDWFEGLDGPDVTASLALHNQLQESRSTYADTASPSKRKLLALDIPSVCSRLPKFPHTHLITLTGNAFGARFSLARGGRMAS